MEITTENIKKLRDETGISVMQCKKALEEASGDMEKARMILSKKSGEIAAKKSDRETKEGVVSALSNDTDIVFVSILCETDFVAKNSDFTSLADTIAQKALINDEENTRKDSESLINATIQKVGENITLDTIQKIPKSSSTGYYIHNKKQAVVVVLSEGNETTAKDIAMHISAMKPEYTTKEEIPTEAKDMALEIFTKEIENIDKPEEIKQKMLQGKIDTYFKERTLLDQDFIKDPSVTIKGLLAKISPNAKIEKIIKIGIVS